MSDYLPTPTDIETALGLPPLSVCASYNGGVTILYPELTTEQQQRFERLLQLGHAPTTAVDLLEIRGVETTLEVTLGASESDRAQWQGLLMQLLLKQDALSKSTGQTWEAVRSAFEAASLTVKTQSGAPWATTIGDFRAAMIEVGDAYLAAWAQSQ